MRRTESDSHSPGQQKLVLFNYTLLACCIGFSDWLLAFDTLSLCTAFTTGTVAAARVIVRGTISGVIRGATTVTLQSSSHVEGDIHHMSLAIEQGAEFDGRCRRAADAAALTADLRA